MTAFDDILAADAVNMAGGEFSEPVIYTPSSPSGGNPTRTIQAVIQRNPPATVSGNPNYITPKMIVVVANSATEGIASATMDTGGDTITVAYRPGETAVAYRIHLPDGTGSMDAALLTFELR